MPVSCPNCGDLHPDGTTTCATCGRPIPAQAESKPRLSPRDFTPEQQILYTRMIFRYTMLPIAIVVLAMCAGSLLCSTLLR